MRRVLDQVRLIDHGETFVRSMSLTRGHTAPEEIMRVLRTVILNGLGRPLRELEVSLNHAALPPFLECMRPDLLPNLESVELLFQEMPAGAALEALRRVQRLSEHRPVSTLRLTGAVPRTIVLPKDLRTLKIHATEAFSTFGDASMIALAGMPEVWNLLLDLQLTIAGATSAWQGIAAIRNAPMQGFVSVRNGSGELLLQSDVATRDGKYVRDREDRFVLSWTPE
jgi:hypothetical protein